MKKERLTNIACEFFHNLRQKILQNLLTNAPSGRIMTHINTKGGNIMTANKFFYYFYYFGMDCPSFVCIKR